MALCFRSLARSSARGSFVFTPTTSFSGKLLHFPSWNLADRRSGFCNSAASLKSTTNDLLKDLDKTNLQHVRPILEQVVTDNGSAYKAAGGLIMSHFPQIYWTPCAAHCIDLLLEDFAKIPWIKKVIRRAKYITKFVYAHPHLHHLFCQCSNGKEIIRPSTTRFATNYILLDSLQDAKDALMDTFVSNAWKNDDRFASLRRTPEAHNSLAIIFDCVEKPGKFWFEVMNVIEARRTATTKEVFHSDFLTPPVLEDTISALTKMPHVDFLIQGGYPQAERCRLTVGHPDVMSSAPDAVSAISISGNFSFDPTSDVDFLEAILSTGAKREKVGDVLLQGDKGAQTIVASELVDHLVCSIKQVRRVPVSCSAIPLLALEFRSPRTKVLKSVEASLRVDAVASAGFQISRSKLVSLISTGDVHVNGTNVTKNGITLKTGDIISIRGKGRVQLGEIKTTRKGKFSIELIRYL